MLVILLNDIKRYSILSSFNVSPHNWLECACLHSSGALIFHLNPGQGCYFGIVNANVRLLSVQSELLWNGSCPSHSSLPNSTDFCRWLLIYNFLDKYLYLIRQSLMIIIAISKFHCIYTVIVLYLPPYTLGFLSNLLVLSQNFL